MKTNSSDHFVRMCKALRVINIEAFISLTDKTLLAIVDYCPLIESIHISGNVKVFGKVITASPDIGHKPREESEMSRNHRSTSRWRRRASEETFIVKARPTLLIKTGSTLGDGMGAVSWPSVNAFPFSGCYF